MKRWIFTAASFVAVIAFTIYAVRDGAAGVNLALPPLAHALALVAFCVDLGGRGFKMTFSARAVGSKLGFFTSIRAGLGGDFGAAITPSHSGAEPARYLILAEAGADVRTILVVLYAELFFEMIGLLVSAALMVVAFDSTRGALLSLAGVLAGYCGTILGIGAVGWFLGRRNLGDEPPRWAERLRLTGTRWVHVRHWVDRFANTVDSFKRMHRGWALASCSVSVVHVIARFTILPILVLLATRAPVAIGPLVLWPFSLLYGGAMLPAPGGGGAVELAFRSALGDSIPSDVFAAAMMWWRFYTFYLLIGLGALVAGNAALRAIQARQLEKMESGQV